MVEPAGFGFMRLHCAGAALCVCCRCIERCLLFFVVSSKFIVSSGSPVSSESLDQ
jgi:hypothetical protein